MHTLPVMADVGRSRFPCTSDGDSPRISTRPAHGWSSVLAQPQLQSWPCYLGSRREGVRDRHDDSLVRPEAPHACNRSIHDRRRR
jgi:hypothetical protein